MPRSGARNAKRRKRSNLREFIGLLILATSLYGFASQQASTRLRRAMSEAAADTPNWMVRDLSADRKKIPDDRNSAKIVRRVVRALPGGWVAHRRIALYERLSELNRPATGNHANERLAAADLSAIRRELADAADALRKAEPLATAVMEGRSEFPDERGMFDRELTAAQGTRRVVRLLQLDAFLKTELEEPDAALADCRMLFNVARSIGDEPSLLSQLVRIAEGNVALKMLQRALAHGQPSERELRDLDAFLAEEETFPHLLFAFRGERADYFEFMQRFGEGEVAEPARLPAWFLKIGHPYFIENQSRMLRLINEAVEIAKTSGSAERPRAWASWTASLRPKNTIDRAIGSFATMCAPALESASEAEMLYKSRLACARTMIALERYRRTNHRWPETLAPLVPEFLRVLPLDPRVAKPVRFARVADGLVVYSVGQNLIDDGGKLGPQIGIKIPATDDGYRLWDLDARHLPALASHPDPWDDNLPLNGTEPQ